MIKPVKSEKNWKAKSAVLDCSKAFNDHHTNALLSVSAHWQNNIMKWRCRATVPGNAVQKDDTAGGGVRDSGCRNA